MSGLVQFFFRQLLHFTIERQDQIFAGLRQHMTNDTHLAAARVDFNEETTVLTMQGRIIETLKTGFADPVSTVVDLLGKLLELVIGNFPDIPQNVRSRFALGIIALLLDRE